MGGRRGAAIALLSLAGLTFAAGRLLDVVQVRGRSMLPTLRPGDRLLVARTLRRPWAGAIVLAPDPRDARRELVKRVTIAGSPHLVLRGDNPAESTDGRTFGAIRADSVRWAVVLRYWPPGAVGLLRGAPAVVEPEGGEPACTDPGALLAGPGAMVG